MVFYYINSINKIGTPPRTTQIDRGYYFIAYDLDHLGEISYLSKTAKIPGAFGKDSQGGGISLYIGTDGTIQMVAYYMDDVRLQNQPHAYIGNYRR